LVYSVAATRRDLVDDGEWIVGDLSRLEDE
jgi:hypothetical protein